MMRIRRKEVLFIGGPIIKVLGLSCGALVVEVDPEKCEVPTNFRDMVYNSGVIVVEEDVYNKCSNVKELLDQVEESCLIVKLPHPRKIVEPRKYYEELLRKIIGLRISL